MLIFLMFMTSLSVMAQRNFTVTGKVVSAADGMGLPGVSIIIKGTTIGTVTNGDGSFKIDIDKGSDVLVFSMIGFAKQEIANINSENLTVELTEQMQELQDVLVVGYGTQKKASSVGSIAQTKGEELIKVGAVTNISSALAGMLPGVTALNKTGEPGLDQADLLIRGRSTWNGSNAPLILVDGIERTMVGVDPNEVESVSVLKDASATAVFGVKGANGVILITTKRGSVKAPTVSINTNFGVKQQTNDYDHLDVGTIFMLNNETQYRERNWGSVLSQEEIDIYVNGTDPIYHPNYEWKDLVLKDFGFTQNYNVNVDGGTERAKYFVSVGYLNDGDIYKTEKQAEYDPRFKYERYNYRSNIDYKLTKTTDLGINLAGEIGVRQRPLSWLGRDPLNGANVTMFNELFYQAPNTVFPVYYPNGYLGTDAVQRGANIIYNLNYQGAGMEKSTRLFTDINLKQDLGFLLKGLSAKGKISYNSYLETQQVTYKDIIGMYQMSEDSDPILHSTYQPAQEWVEKPAEYDDISTSDYQRDLYYELSANYANSWGNHDVTGLILFNRRKNNYRSNFPSYEESWASRATYAYASKYLAEFTGGYTGSEKFARGQRFGFFPAFGLGWVLSEESFYKESNFSNILNYAKIKYTYGEVGSDRGASPFTYISDYTTKESVTFGHTQAYTYGPLYYEGKAANVNATWETATKENLAFEFKVINKLNIEIDLFKERRTGILMTRGNTTPKWFGQQAPDANIGETKSHGYEILLKWRDNVGPDFSYFVSTFVTFNENRVVFRDDPPNRVDYQRAEGKPISTNYYLLNPDLQRSWDDVYAYTASSWENTSRMPGDLAYIDFNADGLIDEIDYAPVRLDEIPAYSATTNLGVTYKNFSLAANFNGVWGTRKRLNGAILWGTDWPESLDRWTPETAEIADRPRNDGTIQKHNRQNSTYGIQNAAFLRLKSAEFSYNVHKAFLERFGASACTIFVNGNNLFTFTNFDSRVDPEAANTQAYPLLKRYNIGFRLSF